MRAPIIRSAGGTGHRPGGRVVALKLLGLLCCGGPLALLLMFAFGEGGTTEGWGHLVQAVPLVALVLFAWWRPLVGGLVISVAATALGIIFVATSIENAWWWSTALMFFAPAIVGGLLFAAAGVAAAKDSRQDAADS